MHLVKPVLQQIGPLLRLRIGRNFTTFNSTLRLIPIRTEKSRTNEPFVRYYSEKLHRPKGLDDQKKTGIDLKKKVGPISWFNLGVSGVLIGVMMAFYYYAR